jgi:adenosylcobyric acid synthase
MKNRIRPIMFVGIGSDVGKSVINTAFCRVLLQDGYSPAPFKAQNMSLNSFATKDNLEIGRAQAVQAEACGIESTSDMNPILLKPISNNESQIILNGKPVGNKSAAEYFREEGREKLFKSATRAYDTLNSIYNPIVLEGAGSISELNLKSKDIVNMRMAMYSGAATYIVADIDKGGIFASLYGSVMLLTPEERKAIRGIIINKFRGDIELFNEGKRLIEELTGVPVVAILPWYDDILIDQEDSVVLEKIVRKKGKQGVKIAVVHLKHMSNFTDFNILEHLPQVSLFYTRDNKEIESADIVIIPGSKNVIYDLNHLRSSGLAGAILRHHSKGKPLYGICGGYQIMGKWIHDPYQIEGDIESAPGLGILPIETTLQRGKVTRRCTFTLANSRGCGKGYEIHSGVSSGKKPFAILDNGEEDGFYLNTYTWGTYIHGVFDNPSLISLILSEASKKDTPAIEFQDIREENYNKLAEWFRSNSELDYIYKTMAYD